MAPRLRVLAGTSPSTMVPITPLVNTSKSFPISSPLFEGAVVAHIKGLTDEQGRVRSSEYFEREDRKGVTWSIQVQGRFLVPYSADDILFGNTFDRPLKLPWGTSAVLKFMNYIDPTLEHDLTSSSKPWALSPLITTMPHFMHHRVFSERDLEQELEALSMQDRKGDAGGVPPPFPPPYSIRDSTEELYLALADVEDSSSVVSESRSRSGSSASSSSSNSNISAPAPGLSSKAYTPSSSPPSSYPSSSGSSLSGGSKRSRIGAGTLKLKDAVRKVRRKDMSMGAACGDVDEGREERKRALKALSAGGASQRRSYFAQGEKRREVVFGPEDVITTDFCYGFINFAPSLSLQLPGGLSFDLMRYWDGQPVRFVCCERRKAGGGDGDGEGEDGVPWGRIFWCVAIEVVDSDEGDGEDSGDGESDEVD